MIKQDDIANPGWTFVRFKNNVVTFCNERTTECLQLVIDKELERLPGVPMINVQLERIAPKLRSPMVSAKIH